MVSQDEIRKWIRSYCPLFWSLLSERAQGSLPKGLVEYIDSGTQSEIEDGRNHLVAVENYLTDLKKLCGWRTVCDSYRRDFSGVDSEKRLAELFCEIALCTALGKLSNKLQLRPLTGKGTHSDCLFNLHGFDIYGEAKRYADPWPYIERANDRLNREVPYSRSISERPADEKPRDSARPRSMDLRSKLRDAHRQFPEGKLSILFVFHPSLGESDKSKSYLTQALFGDSNFFNKGNNLVLEPGGLFSNEEWRNISACCLARINPESEVILPFIWKNPRAFLEISKPVFDALSRMSNIRVEATR